MKISAVMCHISLSVNNKDISVLSEITFSLGMAYTVVEWNSYIEIKRIEVIFL